MNKEKFLDALRRRLSGLPQEDIDERIAFYEEMIDDRMEEGLSEEEATATIIRGFLDVRIDGLPDALQKQIDDAIDSADHGF